MGYIICKITKYIPYISTVVTWTEQSMNILLRIPTDFDKIKSNKKARPISSEAGSQRYKTDETKRMNQ
jgi:hypothetical protein